LLHTVAMPQEAMSTPS